MSDFTFSLHAPEPTYILCDCCESEFHHKEMKEGRDGFLCSSCWDRCQEILESDEEAHMETFNKIFGEVSNA